MNLFIREFIFFIILIYSYSISTGFLKLVIALQFLTHILLSRKYISSCNPEQGPIWCNNIALFFGMMYIYQGIMTKKYQLIFIGIYIALSHLFFIDLLNKSKKLNEKITVCTLNYKRPYNMVKQLNELIKYDLIDEIIVGHGCPKSKEYVFKNTNYSDKIKHFDDDNKLGGAIRFYIADKYASNEKILFLDDDIIPSLRLIEDMTRSVDDNLLVGPIVRECNKSVGSNNSKLYILLSQILDINLNHDVVLTPTLMTKKEVLSRVLKIIDYKYKDFLIKTRGNGEDLLFNKVFTSIYNKVSTRVNGKYRWLDYKSHSYQSRDDFQKPRDEICINKI